MLVFMFPGQSSRYPGMLERAVRTWPAGMAVVDQASDILGRDLWAHYSSESDVMFCSSEHIQVGVFLTSYLYQQALADNGVIADMSLGLSLGEYNHLVHIGAIDFDEALRLVAVRGRVYDNGPQGMMASVFPLPVEQLSEYLTAAREHGEVVAANFNSPSQTVIGGHDAAVLAAVRLIEEEDLGIKAIITERRWPMHTPLFLPVAQALRPYLADAVWRTPRLPYIPNVGVDSAFIDAPRPRDFVQLLTRHVHSSVMWRRSIEAIVARESNARFIEVGPGRVLSNLIQRRWLKNDKYSVDGDGPGVRTAVKNLSTLVSG